MFLKYFSLALLLLFSAGTLRGEKGPKIPLIGSDPITLPERFVISDKGIRYVLPETTELIEIRWNDVDLPRFALMEPALNRLREQMILLGEKELIEVQPTPNYFKEFLESPLTIRFNQEFEKRRNLRYQYHFQPIQSQAQTQSDPTSVNDGFTVQGSAAEQELFADLTRPEFNSTVEGFLLMISDSSTTRSRRLIRDLREHQSLYANLIIGITNLENAYPEQREITIGKRALQQFSRSPTISIDDQKALASFLQFARIQAEK